MPPLPLRLTSIDDSTRASIPHYLPSSPARTRKQRLGHQYESVFFTKLPLEVRWMIYRLILQVGDLHMVAKRSKKPGHVRISHVKRLQNREIDGLLGKWDQQCWGCGRDDCKNSQPLEEEKPDTGPLSLLLSCRRVYVGPLNCSGAKIY